MKTSFKFAVRAAASVVATVGFFGILLSPVPGASSQDRPLSPMIEAPAFMTTPGNYGLAYAGKGTAERKGSSVLMLDLPAAPVSPHGAWLYLSGMDTPGPKKRLPRGDTAVRVEITDGTGATTVVKKVPIVYRVKPVFLSKLDLTPYLTAGKNKIAISRYDLNRPQGAFAFAVYNAGPAVTPRLIQIQDGLDNGYYPLKPPNGPDSEVVCFSFDPVPATRDGRVVMVLADMEAGRGDEIFMVTGSGAPGDLMPDSDRDRLPDIVYRNHKLRLKDYPPLGNDPGFKNREREAMAGAISLEEDQLGVARKKRGFNVGAQLDVFTSIFTVPAGHTFAGFQVQSENPERGDSFTLLLAMNEVLIGGGFNPVPEIVVVKDAVPTELPETGGEAQFTVSVTNVGLEAVNLTRLNDDQFGDLNGKGGCALPQTIPMYGTYTCRFVAAVTGKVGIPHVDIVTGSGVGVVSGDPVSDDDDARITFRKPPGPAFHLLKSASIEVGYPGDPVTYEFTVVNDGEIDLVDVVVWDDVLGDIGTVTVPVGQSVKLFYPDWRLPACVGTGWTRATLCDGATQITDRCSVPNTATATWDTLTRQASDCVNILPFGAIGDFAWNDLNHNSLQDPGEPGLPGVLMTLSRDGTPIASTTTDGEGDYLLGSLKAGNYSVAAGEVTGFVRTTPPTHPVTLGIGEVYRLADFGYWKPSPGLLIEKTVSPLEVHPGDPLTYTYVVTNTGDAVLVDISVVDDRLGPIGSIARLEPGARGTLTMIAFAPACGEGGTTTVPCIGQAGILCVPAPCYLRNLGTAIAFEEIFHTLVTDDDDACIKILPVVN